MRESHAAIMSMIHGHSNRITRSEPPPYTRSPYTDLTVAIKVTEVGEVTLSTKDIATFLVTQLGLDPVTLGDKVVFRLKRVDAYANAVGASANAPKVKMMCNSLIPVTVPDTSTHPEMKSLEDTGNLSRNAVVSYTWPVSQSGVVLGMTPDVVCARVITFAANSTELRVHVNWSWKSS